MCAHVRNSGLARSGSYDPEFQQPWNPRTIMPRSRVSFAPFLVGCTPRQNTGQFRRDQVGSRFIVPAAGQTAAPTAISEAVAGILMAASNPERGPGPTAWPTAERNLVTGLQS